MDSSHKFISNTLIMYVTLVLSSLFKLISSIEVTPYLPPGVTISATVTTTSKDFDKERFTFINEADEDDPRPGGKYGVTSIEDIKLKRLDKTNVTNIIDVF